MIFCLSQDLKFLSKGNWVFRLKCTVKYKVPVYFTVHSYTATTDCSIYI